MQYEHPFSTENGLKSTELRLPPSERLQTQRRFRFTTISNLITMYNGNYDILEP